MEWAENTGDEYILGLAGNRVLDARVAETANDLRFRHALSAEDKLRCYESFEYQAGSWSHPRRVVGRLEASLQPDLKEGGMRQAVNIRRHTLWQAMCLHSQYGQHAGDRGVGLPLCGVIARRPLEAHGPARLSGPHLHRWARLTRRQTG